MTYKTLYEALSTRSMEELRGIAKNFPLGKPARKNEYIDAIVELLAGDGLRKYFDKLGSLSKQVVAEVIHKSNGYFFANRIKAICGEAPLLYKRGEYVRESKKTWTLLDILFTDLEIPNDLLERLKAFVPIPEKHMIKTLDELPPSCARVIYLSRKKGGEKFTEIPLMVCETESAALHDLIAVLRLIDAGKVSLSPATKRTTYAAAKQVCSVLRDGDFISQEDANKAEDYIRSFAWPMLMNAAALARLNGTKLELTKAGRNALAAPTHDTIKNIWDRWLSKGTIDEFNRIDAIKGQNKNGRGGLTDPADRRSYVCDVLFECPPGKWIEMDELFRYFIATGVDLEVVEDTWRLYISEQQYGNLGYEGYAPFSLLQGRYIMVLLWEYAATLGLVDIAHIPPDGARDDFRRNWGTDFMDYLSRYDGMMYFRVTPLGAYCFDITEEYTPKIQEQRSVFTILPNHDIVTNGAHPLTPADAIFLERIAAQNGENTWTLDKSRILTALETGIREEEVFSFLETKSQSPIPGNVRQYIDDTMRRATLIAYEGMAEVFKAPDEATALLILHDKAAKPLCSSGGDNRLIVKQRNMTAFRRALRQLGFITPSGKQDA